jgi:hypothetical protein
VYLFIFKVKTHYQFGIIFTHGPIPHSSFQILLSQIVLFMIGETSNEPQTMEPEKCHGWEWHEWSSLPVPHRNTNDAANDNVHGDHFPCPEFYPLRNLRLRRFNPFVLSDTDISNIF